MRSRTPPWPRRMRPVSFVPRSRLTSDSKRSPIVAAATMTAPKHEGSPGIGEEILFVEGDKRRQDSGDRARGEPLPCLTRRDDRRHLVSARHAAGDVGERVGDEDGEEDGDQRKGAVRVEVADENQVPKAEADPACSEDCRRDRHRGRLAGFRNSREDERQDEREKKAAEHPRDAVELRRRACRRPPRRSPQGLGAAAIGPGGRTRARPPAHQG